MKLKFCTESIILAVAIGINVAIFVTPVEQNKLTAQTVNRASRKPTLPPRGVPGNRTAAISRGDSCDRPSQDLIALAPEFTQANENSVWGQTTSAHPAFWFFMPHTSTNSRLEFSLQDDREENIGTPIPINAPQRPGIISVQIPASWKPLQVNQKYRWKLRAKIYCDKGVTEEYTIGWVSRVNPSSSSDGIWYDEVTSLAQQLLLDPNNVQLKQDWNHLLNSANLEKVANQPLLR